MFMAKLFFIIFGVGFLVYGIMQTRKKSFFDITREADRQDLPKGYYNNKTGMWQVYDQNMDRNND